MVLFAIARVDRGRASQKLRCKSSRRWLDFITDRARMSLNLRTKLAYGLGEWGGEIPGSLQVFFILFFLTNVAGLSPGTASSVLVL